MTIPSRTIVPAFLLLVSTTATPQADIRSVAQSLASGRGTVLAKAEAIFDWMESEIEWTSNAPEKPEQVLGAKKGNRGDEPFFLAALLNAVGIKTRIAREIAIEEMRPDREAAAKRAIQKDGNSMSVFGLRHNNHSWLEFFDEGENDWAPADTLFGVIGERAWVRSRVGFEPRPPLGNVSAHNVLVPFAVFGVGPNGELVSRTKHYCIDAMARIYGSRITRDPAWKEWCDGLMALEPVCMAAFQGKANLHEQDDRIAGLQVTYLRLRAAATGTPVEPAATKPAKDADVDILKLAAEITASAASTTGKVTALVAWTNANLQWTATDYKTRTVQDILARKAGNCADEAKVLRALLDACNIKNRLVREINIQPASERRQKSAEQLVLQKGPSYSVFGMRHNDHVWLEYQDTESGEWQPADATLALVGRDAWMTARVGFGERPTHDILPSRDMLVPICVFAIGPDNSFESRTSHYLVESFAKMLDPAVLGSEAWKEWTQRVHAIDSSCLDAFQGKGNLHACNDAIKELEESYRRVKKEADR